jgi:outer membrane lipoprotein-sorting protein
VTRLDDKLIPRAFDIVAKYGRVATFSVRTKTEDETTGQVTFSEPVKYRRKITPPSNYGLALVDGETIKAGDASVTLPAQNLPFTPYEGMQLEIGDDTWTVISIEPLVPGENAAAYVLQLRK